jgi:hypothetical protein
MPAEWDADVLDQIEEHVLSVAKHPAEFELEIRRKIT